MSNTKPQITATIKFRDVTIENMTLDELRALRDELNKIVGGEKEYIPYPQPYPVYLEQPWQWQPYWVTVSTGTIATNKIVLDGSTGSLGVIGNAQHYTLSCVN